MQIGYARTSTVEQAASFEAQRRDLLAAGCDKVFEEQVSATARLRPQLEQALDYLRDGDVLVVSRLDRLARSMAHLCQITEALSAKKASLRTLDGSIDTGSANGRFTLNLFGAVAQFEKELMLERQKEGIAAAKAKGRYKGRKPTAMAKADEVRQLASEGVARTEIAKRLGIGRTSVYRCLAEVLAEG